jgi:hypothetical protein
LHMSDFVGHGKYAGLYPELKRNLFLAVAKLINEHKLYSVSISVSQTDFGKMLSREVRKTLIGPYAFAFFAIVLVNRQVSKKLRDGPVRIAYLVDRGFGHQEQLNQAHEVIVRLEKAVGEFRYTGALATDTDDDIPALQAADAIAWASRQISLNGALPEGFEPLAEVLRGNIKPPHQRIHIPKDGIQMLAEPINAWISKNGRMPQITDIVARQIGEHVVKLKA